MQMELFRFRQVRAIQSQPSSGLDLTEPLQEGSSKLGLSATLEEAQAYVKNTMIDPRTWANWIATVSSQLAAQGDLIAPSAWVTLLPHTWQSQVTTKAWATTKADLTDSLVAAFIAKQPPEIVEGLCRLLRVQDLVSALAADSKLSAANRALQTPEDIRRMVTWRTVILPVAYFTQNPNPLLAREPGVTDLYVVKDEWNRYEAGEIAQIINVLPGETFENVTRHSVEVDTLSSTTTEQATSYSTEQDQTNTTSLSQASTQDASLNIGVQGQVQTSGQYGPTHVQTSLGAQLQDSQTTSDSRAQTTSSETVQRALKSVSETVTAIQSTRTVTRDSTSDDHKLENADGNPVTVGIYRWINEIHRVQLESYPNRFVLEFEIPEPGAWLRWALQSTPSSTWDNPDPGPFGLGPADITETNYTDYAKQWRAQGISPPPPDTITLSVKLSAAPSSDAVFMASDNSLTVPTGYEANSWTAQVFSIRDWSWQQYGTEIEVLVGGPGSDPAGTGDLGNAAIVSQNLNGSVGGISTGPVPITVYAVAVQGFVCVVNVTCNLMPAALAQWQETTFDQLASAYQTLLSAYQQERDSRNEDVSGQTDLAGPPALNATRAANELRRLVIQDLMGVRFDGEPATDIDAATEEPDVDLQEAYDTADIVQFYEQAFEWENLVYICYPYYWARRNDANGNSVWVVDATSASADPVFDQFLNAGSARVVVPARPGFENLVAYFLYTGEIWGGGQPPAPNDPGYLSIAEEIQAVEEGPTDGTPVGSSWEYTLPTTLIWAGTDPSTLPTNPAPTIPAPTP